MSSLVFNIFHLTGLTVIKCSSIWFLV